MTSGKGEFVMYKYKLQGCIILELLGCTENSA